MVVEESPPDTLSWPVVVNIVKDVKLLYSLRDANDIQGGSGPIQNVLGNSDTSCLGAATHGGYKGAGSGKST